MTALSVRITHRAELNDRAVERGIQIDFDHNAATISIAEGRATAAAVEAATGLPTVASNAEPTPSNLEWSDTLCDGERVNHAAAEKACAAVGEGWRLPTRTELPSLVDDTRHDPAIDTARFPDTQSGAYWTSTPCAWASSYAWIVDFGGGGAYGFLRDNGSAFVRAVRAVPAGQ